MTVTALLVVAALAAYLAWRNSPRLRRQLKDTHAAVTGRLDGLRGHRHRPKQLIKRAASQTLDAADHDAQGRLMLHSFALVLLHPNDYELLERMQPQHRDELEAELERRARAGGLRTFAPPRVEFALDASAWRGHPRVRVEYLDGTLQNPTQEVAVYTLEPLNPRRLPPLRLLDLTQVLGRSAARSHLVVSDPRVSGSHCRITRTDDGDLTIEDLDSHNHTYVNGVEIKTATVLHEGDEVGLGRYVRFRIRR